MRKNCKIFKKREWEVNARNNTCWKTGPIINRKIHSAWVLAPPWKIVNWKGCAFTSGSEKVQRYWRVFWVSQRVLEVSQKVLGVSQKVVGVCQKVCRATQTIMWVEKDCFYYIIVRTDNIGLHSRRHPMEFDAGTRPFASPPSSESWRRRERTVCVCVCIFTFVICNTKHIVYTFM